MIHWLQSLLTDYGYAVVFFVVFLNNLGLPVPGDTILLGAGILVEKGTFSLAAALITGTAACFLGGTCAYWIGLRYGHPLLRKIHWLQITPKRIKRLEDFFKKYGAKAVFFARFIALLHPVTGLLAGMGKTPFRAFLFYNFAGSAVYSGIYIFVGTFFGQRWELFKTWIGPVALYVLLIVTAVAILVLFLRKSIQNFLAGFSRPHSKKRPR